MFKILIVDDERMIRTGIEKTIPWRSLKIDTVYTAASAGQVMEMIEKYQPDLMITDIQMAQMSGLELVKTIKEQAKDMRIIILTGYDKFEYAREALQLQVHDFLLKPIDEEELTRSIGEQIQQLEQIRQRQWELSRRQRTKGVAQQKHLEAVLKDYLHSNPVSQEREEKFYQEFQFAKDQEMRLGIILPDQGGMKDEDEGEFYMQTISQICMNLIDEQGRGITFTQEEEGVLIVFFSGTSQDTGEDAKENAEQLLDILENECDRKPKLILGGQVRGFKNLGISYNDAIHVLNSERKGFEDIFYSQTESKKNDIFQDIFREFKQAMTENYADIDAVIHILNRFQTAAQSYNLGRKYVANCYFELASTIYFTFISETGNVPEESLNSFSQSLVGIDKDKAKEVTEMFLWKLLAKEEGDEHEIIRKVKNRIHEDLTRELTVANLAAELYVSPNYLSRLFKKMTGEGCNEYIVRKRIEKAKSLLETTTLKTGEIALMVGYHDMNYFSLAFKKHTGYSPTKYRNLMQK